MNDNTITRSILWSKGYRINNKGEWFRPPNPVDYPPPSPVSKRDTCDEPKGPDKREAPHARGRCRIVITSYRVKLLDCDNPFPKWFIDGVRHCGLIPDDDPRYVGEVAFRQVQVHHRVDEHTELVIEALEE